MPYQLFLRCWSPLLVGAALTEGRRQAKTRHNRGEHGASCFHNSTGSVSDMLRHAKTYSTAAVMLRHANCHVLRQTAKKDGHRASGPQQTAVCPAQLARPQIDCGPPGPTRRGFGRSHSRLVGHLLVVHRVQSSVSNRVVEVCGEYQEKKHSVLKTMQIPLLHRSCLQF